MSERNIWLDGIMGVVVGDALGLPVQFSWREERVKEMGKYDVASRSTLLGYQMLRRNWWTVCEPSVKKL